MALERVGGAARPRFIGHLSEQLPHFYSIPRLRVLLLVFFFKSTF